MWEARRPQGNALLCAAHGPQSYNPNPHMERAVPVTDLELGKSEKRLGNGMMGCLEIDSVQFTRELFTASE